MTQEELKTFIAEGLEIWGKLANYNELELRFRCALDELEKMEKMLEMAILLIETHVPRDGISYRQWKQAINKLEES